VEHVAVRTLVPVCVHMAAVAMDRYLGHRRIIAKS
jgi:hypothetical protein